MTGLHIEVGLRTRWQVWPLVDRLIPGFRLHLPFLHILVYWE